MVAWAVPFGVVASSDARRQPSGEGDYGTSIPERPTELYDMHADPYDLQSLANDPAPTAIKGRLAAELAALRSAPPRPPRKRIVTRAG